MNIYPFFLFQKHQCKKIIFDHCIFRLNNYINYVLLQGHLHNWPLPKLRPSLPRIPSYWSVTPASQPQVFWTCSAQARKFVKKSHNKNTDDNCHIKTPLQTHTLAFLKALSYRCFLSSFSWVEFSVKKLWVKNAWLNCHFQAQNRLLCHVVGWQFARRAPSPRTNC